RHTRSTRDWSSDVCSSDLHPLLPRRLARGRRPIITDVRGDTPLTRGQRSPGPRFVRRVVVACAQDNRSAGGDDRAPPARVDVLHDQAVRIATISLDVVHAPRGELRDILVFVI